MAERVDCDHFIEELMIVLASWKLNQNSKDVGLVRIIYC